MQEKRTDVVTLIVPLATEAQDDAWQKLSEELLHLANGYSETTGRGVWRADDMGAIYRERHLRVEVALFNPAVGVTDIVGAFVRYGQEAGERALYYQVNGEPRYLDLGAERKAGIA